MFKALVAALLFTVSAQGAAARILSFNILYGGDHKTSLEATADVIRKAAPDVVGLQETDSNGAELARRLGYHWHPVEKGTRPGGIASRHPITAKFRQGAEVTLPGGERIYVFSVHLRSDPYEPYDIKDRKLRSEQAVIDSARTSRGAEIRDVLVEMAPLLASGAPVFLVGDFNEPSHLDWTDRAGPRGAKLHRMKVRWPTSRAVSEAGLEDSYRMLHPDETKKKGYTWTPVWSWGEVHDRIDFVYFAGKGVRPTRTEIVGEKFGPDVDLVGHTPYPSDHRGVVSQFSWN